MTDVQALANALTLHRLEQGGELPMLKPGPAKEVCKFGRSDCGDLLNLDAIDAIAKLPVDTLAQSNDRKGTGYGVAMDRNGIVTVTAMLAEEGKVISATAR
jgi:hypothetical protein